MNLRDAKFKDFALVQEMLQTPQVMRQFDFAYGQDAAQIIRNTGKLLLTGEGSSRIFPAKNLIYEALKLGASLSVFAEGGRQAREYNLAEFAVFGASNSGKTTEVVSLFSELAAQGHPRRFGLTAHRHTNLEAVSSKCYLLNCGREEATAATKSVVEQALFYRSLLCPLESGECVMLKNQQAACQRAQEVLEADLDPAIVESIAQAPVVYFAGRNNGVAEELALKANEITRKKSDYLEGTYAVHGIEEVMAPDEVVLAINPFPADVEKFKKVLVDGVGLKVIAVAAEETIFPTIRIPKVEGYQSVLELLAGWNLLVHVGVALGINLDKAQRARKIGYEVVG